MERGKLWANNPRNSESNAFNIFCCEIDRKEREFPVGKQRKSLFHISCRSHLIGLNHGLGPLNELDMPTQTFISGVQRGMILETHYIGKVGLEGPHLIGSAPMDYRQPA